MKRLNKTASPILVLLCVIFVLFLEPFIVLFRRLDSAYNAILTCLGDLSSFVSTAVVALVIAYPCIFRVCMFPQLLYIHLVIAQRQKIRKVILRGLTEASTRTEQFYIIRLTHLCRIDSSTLTLWTGSFPI